MSFRGSKKTNATKKTMKEATQQLESIQLRLLKKIIIRIKLRI